MNCLVWNFLGLGNPCTGKKLGDIIWAKVPSVMFIAETLADEARLDTVQRNIYFDIYIYIYKGGSKSRSRWWFSSLFEVISEFGGGWFIALLYACVRTYVKFVKNICHIELTNHLTKRTLLVIG